MKNLFLLLRPHQWLKNLFVLVGIIFSHEWQNLILVRQAIFTVFAFCLLSGAMYIFNDIVDQTADRAHPIKKNRPLAAGTVNTTHAVMLGFVVGGLGLILGFTVSATVMWILLAYAALNIAYSEFFKQKIILDVFVIATGFLLRILAGTIGIGIPPTGWLLFCSFMLTLFLGFCKRSAEMQFNAQGYSENLLNKLMTITATSSIVGYTLYTLQQNKLMIYTVPLVMFGIFRYLYLLENKTYCGIDMARDLMRDKQLLTTVIIWLLAIVVIGLK